MRRERVLGVVLQNAGFETHLVASAEAAMKLLEAITELELPVMTGLMLIETIRGARPRVRETPIVVATSNDGYETKRGGAPPAATSSLPSPSKARASARRSSS